MKVNYKSKKCEELVNQILACRNHNDVLGMQSFAVELMNLAEDIQDTYAKSAALFYMSMAAFIQGKYEHTISLCMQLLNQCNHQDVPNFHAQTLNMMGIVYASMSDFMASLSYLLKAYYYSMDHEDLNYCHFPLNNIGALFHNLEIPDLALKYFLKSYEFNRKINPVPTGNEAIPVINIIGANIKLRRYEEAEKWFDIYNRDYKPLENIAIKSEVNIQQIYLCAHYQDLEKLYPLIEDLLIITDGVLDQNRYFKILLESLEICIDLNLKDLAYRILNRIEAVPESINDVLALHRLSYVKVKMAIQFHTDNNYETLYQYYLKNEEYRELEKHNMRQSLLTKIELENMLNEHHQVLMNNERLLKNNELDSFTGVYNKTSFKKHVSNALHKHTKDEYAAMLMIDIDDFKKINDTFGHYIGDQVILDVVGLLKKEIQSSILVGRVGGDEFAVFFSSLYSIDYLYEKVEKYLNNTKKIIVNESAGLITISIGVCVIEHNESFDDIYKKADHALYMAKRKGKSQYAVYSEDAADELSTVKETMCTIALDTFLPSIYSILNTERLFEDKLYQILEHCLSTLNLKHAFILFFNNQLGADKICILNKYETPPHKSIKGEDIDIKQIYLDNFLTSQLYIVRDRNIESHALMELKFTATMQCLIEFNQHKLGILAFNDEDAHQWSNQEISLIRTVASALAPYLYYDN